MQIATSLIRDINYARTSPGTHANGRRGQSGQLLVVNGKFLNAMVKACGVRGRATVTHRQRQSRARRDSAGSRHRVLATTVADRVHQLSIIRYHIHTTIMTVTTRMIVARDADPVESWNRLSGKIKMARHAGITRSAVGAGTALRRDRTIISAHLHHDAAHGLVVRGHVEENAWQCHVLSCCGKTS